HDERTDGVRGSAECRRGLALGAAPREFSGEKTSVDSGHLSRRRNRPSVVHGGDADLSENRQLLPALRAAGTFRITRAWTRQTVLVFRSGSRCGVDAVDIFPSALPARCPAKLSSASANAGTALSPRVGSSSALHSLAERF